jgi:hypothetical protein
LSKKKQAKTSKKNLAKHSIIDERNERQNSERTQKEQRNAAHLLADYQPPN